MDIDDEEVASILKHMRGKRLRIAGVSCFEKARQRIVAVRERIEAAHADPGGAMAAVDQPFE